MKNNVVEDKMLIITQSCSGLGDIPNFQINKMFEVILEGERQVFFFKSVSSSRSHARAHTHISTDTPTHTQTHKRF